MKKKTLIKGTLVLIIGAFISRILGFINRIYLSNIIGAEGMGLYQLVFPIYMICYTLCCSGFFTTVSKITAEENAKGNAGNVKKMIRIVSFISTSLGLVLMILLYFSSEWISVSFIHEPRITQGLQVISFSIPFAALSHTLKGYFYGLNKPLLPATTQITEQMIRISFIYIFSGSFLAKGLTYACTMAVAGMVLGEISSCLFVCFFYLKESRTILLSKASKSYGTLLKKANSITIPLTTNRVITTLLSSYETILIPSMLRSYGYSHNYAISVYGTLSGMAMPLIYFPTVITSSAALMLLPAVTEVYAKKQKGLIKNTVSKSIRFSLLIGIVFAFFFLAFGKNLGMIIYGEDYVGTLLISLSLLCPFLYLQSTLGSLLNGINKHMVSFKNNIIGIILRIAAVYLLVPKYGIKGYLIGLMVSLIVVSVLDIYTLMKEAAFHFNPFTFILLPSFCCGGSIAFHPFLQRLGILSYGWKINTFLEIGMYFLILLPLLLLTKCLSFEDFKLN